MFSLANAPSLVVSKPNGKAVAILKCYIPHLALLGTGIRPIGGMRHGEYQLETDMDIRVLTDLRKAYGRLSAHKAKYTGTNAKARGSHTAIALRGGELDILKREWEQKRKWQDFFKDNMGIAFLVVCLVASAGVLLIGVDVVTEATSGVSVG